jgi:hypothetical protein
MIRSLTPWLAIATAIGTLCTTTVVVSAPIDPEACDKATSQAEYDQCMGASWHSNFFFEGDVFDDISATPFECEGRSVVFPCDGEESHWSATSFQPGAYPFVVRAVSYELSNRRTIEVQCDATLEHHVDLYVGSVVPDTFPTIVESFTVPADPSANVGDQEIQLTLKKHVVLQPGEFLYVSVQQAGDVLPGPACANGGNATCLITCPSEEEPDSTFWSNADAAPFPWQPLRLFGVENTPTIGVYGYVQP